MTHYANSGGVHIAYQVVGSGPIDLLFVMGWVTHLDYFWQERAFARFLRRLASFSRLIMVDKRGTGLSDRVAGQPTLDERMDEHCNAEKAHPSIGCDADDSGCTSA
ncbi:MAG: alpha/beta hydrolase [Chloroflexi bacterium]|nr:alpha/beta hydrolase [Chloroflexota bacterium]